MNQELKVEFHVHFRRDGNRKQIRAGKAPVCQALPIGPLPRVSRLMALAIRYDDMLRTGELANYAQIAELGHVSRTQVTHVMTLLQLAPDIQEEVLFLPRNLVRPIRLKDLLPIAATLDWRKQRRLRAEALRP